MQRKNYSSATNIKSTRIIFFLIHMHRMQYTYMRTALRRNEQRNSSVIYVGSVSKMFHLWAPNIIPTMALEIFQPAPTIRCPSVPNILLFPGNYRLLAVQCTLHRAITVRINCQYSSRINHSPTNKYYWIGMVCGAQIPQISIIYIFGLKLRSDLFKLKSFLTQHLK